MIISLKYTIFISLLKLNLNQSSTWHLSLR